MAASPPPLTVSRQCVGDAAVPPQRTPPGQLTTARQSPSGNGGRRPRLRAGPGEASGLQVMDSFRTIRMTGVARAERDARQLPRRLSWLSLHSWHREGCTHGTAKVALMAPRRAGQELLKVTAVGDSAAALIAAAPAGTRTRSIPGREVAFRHPADGAARGRRLPSVQPCATIALPVSARPGVLGLIRLRAPPRA